jgi:hypothetical protein
LDPADDADSTWLAGRLVADSDDWTRIEALRRWGEAGPPETLLRTVVVDDPASWVRRRALDLLARTPDPVGVLRDRAIVDPAEDVRRAALVALRDTPGHDDVDFFRSRMRDDPEETVRAAALWELAIARARIARDDSTLTSIESRLRWEADMRHDGNSYQQILHYDGADLPLEPRVRQAATSDRVVAAVLEAADAALEDPEAVVRASAKLMIASIAIDPQVSDTR